MTPKTLAIALGLALSTAASGQETITVGYFELPPWVSASSQGGKPTGLAVDYWEKTIAPALNVTIKWSGPTPMLRLLEQLRTGDIDAAVILSKNPEREKAYVYPTSPFVQFQPTLLVPKESRLAAVQSPADLAGIRIGYAKGAYLPPFLADPQIKLDLVASPSWIQDNLAKLLAGRIDAVFDVGAESLLAAGSGQPGKLRLVKLPVPAQPIYSAFARTPRATAFAAKYDPANAQGAKAFQEVVQKFTASK